MTEQIIQIVERLQSNVASGIIWNQDFIEIKDALNRKFEKEIRLIQESCLKYEEGGVRAKSYQFPGVSELYWQLNNSLYQMNANIKALARNRKALPGHLCSEMEVLIETWQPIWNLLYVQAKPLIKKGRKPSENPSNSRIRTLENTGTCPVCGKNQKLENGVMVAHGYNLNWGRQEGSCFGVGKKPWEVSPEGAIEYKDALKCSIFNLQKAIENVSSDNFCSIWDKRYKNRIGKDNPRFEMLRAEAIRDYSSEIRFNSQAVKSFEKAIAEWKESTLPGILAGFDR